MDTLAGVDVSSNLSNRRREYAFCERRSENRFVAPQHGTMDAFAAPVEQLARYRGERVSLVSALEKPKNPLYKCSPQLLVHVRHQQRLKSLNSDRHTILT